jgi:hypothetical protein
LPGAAAMPLRLNITISPARGDGRKRSRRMANPLSRQIVARCVCYIIHGISPNPKPARSPSPRNRRGDRHLPHEFRFGAEPGILVRDHHPVSGPGVPLVVGDTTRARSLPKDGRQYTLRSPQLPIRA